MSNKELVIREWLNPITDGDTGAILLKLLMREGTLDGDLQVRDCNKSVTLSLHAHTKSVAKKRIAKLMKIRDACDKAIVFISVHQGNLKKPKLELW